jgi:hypothetical protein
MERQKHGFIYEDYIIQKYQLIKNIKYNGHFDAITTNNIPVQIKYIKNKSEICLGDFRRNMNIDVDFIFHVGFYINSENEYKTINEFTLMIDHEKWNSFFSFEHYDELVQEFNLISNMKIDDFRFREMNFKYRKLFGKRIVSLRLKRDHKHQKRIQCSILYNNFIKMNNLFKIINFNNMDNSRELEKFYTKKQIAELCVNEMFKLVKLNLKNIKFIEPSAGNGVFVEALKEKIDENKIISYDIEPENKYIIKCDFLSLNLKPDENVVIIGNPPYSLAVNFINKCAELSPKFICFILSNVFKKESQYNRINKFYNIKHTIPLPKNSFLLDGKDYHVPSSFYIFEKNIVQRQTKKRINPIGFNYVKYGELCDINIIRVGGRAGKSFDSNDTSNESIVSKHKYNYFIKLNKCVNKNLILKEINKLEWKFNNTTGPKSISKLELNPLLNNIVSKYE